MCDNFSNASRTSNSDWEHFEATLGRPASSEPTVWGSLGTGASTKGYMRSDLICCPLLADGELRFYIAAATNSLNPPAHYDCSL